MGLDLLDLEPTHIWEMKTLYQLFKINQLEYIQSIQNIRKTELIQLEKKHCITGWV